MIDSLLSARASNTETRSAILTDLKDRIPPRIVVAGDQYIWGLEVHELGVESVVRYRLER